MSPNYPRDATEWQEFFSSRINLELEKGKTLFIEKSLPVDSFIELINKEFSTDEGFSASFIPALERNINGLLAWIYGDGDEPYWPGKDGENK